MEKKRGSFGSKFGVVMALAGSAVGLGNIWKFPYITGENGGGAFLLLYLGCIFMIGIPLMITEFMLGRRGGKNVSGCFKVLAPSGKWNYFAILSVVCAFLILSFYGTIAGWGLEYIVLFVKNSFEGLNNKEVVELYDNYISSPLKPLLWQFCFILLTGGVILGGVKKGIERVSKILMPLLFMIIIALDIRSCTLHGGLEGLKFLFAPDFSKLNADSFLVALGHSFFSLSTGMGVLLTYASYIKKKEDLVKTAVQVGLADTLIAILAGIAIFPAVFAFGMEPNAGPGLIYLTLPQVFSQMPFGFFWGVLFFILISFAALTSTISLMEAIVAYVIEELHFSRNKATIITVIGVGILGAFSTLSFGILKDYTLFHLTAFGVMDFLSANILMPLGGLFMCVFAGWIMKKKDVYDELSNGGTKKFRSFNFYLFLIRYIAPLGIIIILLDGLGVFDILK